MFWQAEILREWNELDAAHSLATEAISLCEQAISTTALRLFILGVCRADAYLPLMQ